MSSTTTSRVTSALIDRLVQHFGDTIYARGLSLWKDGAVEYIGGNDVGGVFAIVRGSRNSPYAVTLEVLEDGDIGCFCTCPYDFACKHAVAAVLEWASRGHDDLFEDDDPIFPLVGSYEEEFDPAEQWIDRVSNVLAGGEKAPATFRGRRSNPTMWLYELWMDGDTFGSLAKPAAGSTARLLSSGTSLSLRVGKKLKSGGWGKGTAARIGHDTAYHEHPSASEGDLHALLSAQVQREVGYRGLDKGDAFSLTGTTGAAVIERAIATSRCFLAEKRDRALRAGPPIPLSIEWQLSGESHRVSVDIDLPGDWALIPTEPPSYLCLSSCAIGPIESPLSGAELKLILEAPPLSAEAASYLGDRLSLEQTGESRVAHFPLPLAPTVRRIDVDPTPVIFVHSPSDTEHVSAWRAAPVLIYEDIWLGNAHYDQEALTRIEDTGAEPVIVARRPALEEKYLADFRELCQGFVPCPEAEDRDDESVDHEPIADDPVERFRRFRTLVSRREEIESLGWQLIVIPPVHTEVQRIRTIEARIEPDEDAPGWFGLGMDLVHDGHRYALLPLVVSWLESGGGDNAVYTESVDGDWLEVPASVLTPVARTLAELGEGGGGNAGIRLSRARALSLEVLEPAPGDDDIEVVWQDPADLRELGRRLRALGELDSVPIGSEPRGIEATLRPYQLAGLGWLDTLAEHGLNGILADDMGLGKTLQTIAHIVSQRESGRLNAATLVIAPTSLLGNWSRELAQFAPSLSVRVWHGAERHEQPLDRDKSAVVITSYTLALRDNDLLAEQTFGLLVLDEAQAIKNPNAKGTRALKSLPIERRLCLSGTPLENHLGELWSQFDFLMPGLLGDRTRFTRHFRTPIEKHNDNDRQRLLASAVRPFVLRRRKQDVATELPPKTEIVRTVRLEGQQATFYETLRVAMEERVRKLLASKGLAKSHIEMLDALLKLRQTCCHPKLVKLPSAQRITGSAKTTLALDMIDELVSEGRRILVFSQFTGMLSLLEEGLAARHHRWVKLTGRTRKRDDVIDAFQNGDVPVFLISLKAGGTGLNLTAADTVIHYDPWWNPAVERQASDRAHRIGQTRPVHVYKLVTEGTVEERIVAMQSRKQALADATIERQEGDDASSLSTEDVLSLFEAVD